MALLSYFQIFVSRFTSVILFFFPGLVTYKTVALVVAFISVIAIIYNFHKREFVRKPVIIATLICALFILCYWDTGMQYSLDNSKYDSFFLVLAGQIAPTILCAVIVAREKSVQLQMKRYAPGVGLIFTVIAFFAAFFPTGATTGGFVSNDNNLNYQDTSYLAAYAAAFCYYYLLLRRNFKWPWILKYKYMTYIMVIAVILNLLSIFISGGRGGLVLFVVLTFVSGWLLIKHSDVDFNFPKIIILFLAIAVVGVLAVKYAQSFDSSTNGFKRIIATVVEHDQNGRNILRDKGLQAFDKSPIIGNGVGSVFYEVGEYTHNCITDCLTEVGIIGLLLYLTVIIFTFVRCFKRINIDLSESLWLIIFLDGFIMSLFSGYYLAQIPIYWVVAYMM